MSYTPETCPIARNYSRVTWPKKEDVPERNLELSNSNNSNKLFWMDINFSKFKEYNFSKN